MSNIENCENCTEQIFVILLYMYTLEDWGLIGSVYKVYHYKRVFSQKPCTTHIIIPSFSGQMISCPHENEIKNLAVYSDVFI